MKHSGDYLSKTGGKEVSPENSEQDVFPVQVLSGMPTTTKQDQQALADAKALSTLHARCLQLSVQWRMQYKQSLARAFKMAQACLHALKEA
jgi:hypothetical protein